VPGALGRIVHQTVTRPRARVLIEAHGVEPAEVEQLLPAALERAGAAPERALVLTDRVDVLPALRRAGVGGEHEKSPQRRPLILAERPRIKRVLRLREGYDPSRLEGQ
jgi:hypothetical protein